MDMLDSNSRELTSANVVAAKGIETELDVIKELYERCLRYRLILKQMSTITNDKTLIGESLFVLFII